MRVLVVEDSRTLADALVEGLKDEGIAADVAYDGLHAATKLAAGPPRNPESSVRQESNWTPYATPPPVMDLLLDLTAKEFALLEALMRAQHAVLSAEDLLVQVWDENADPFTKTVHVTISRLQRKLGEPPAIETIHNVGYRITEPSRTP